MSEVNIICSRLVSENQSKNNSPLAASSHLPSVINSNSSTSTIAQVLLVAHLVCRNRILRFRLCIQQESEVARGGTHEVVAAGLADAELAPCAAPLAFLAVLATDHAGHGLEDIVGPDVLGVAGVTV